VNDYVIPAGPTAWTPQRIWAAITASTALRALCLVLAVVAALFLAYKAVGNQITETNVLSEDRVSLAAYMDGTANRPFAYRVLTPLAMHVVRDVLRLPSLVPSLPRAGQDKLADFCARATAQPPAGCDTIVSYFVVAYAFCFVFLMLIYALSLRLFGNPIIALLGLLFTFMAVDAVLLLRLSHIYDFGVMMFVSLMLLCLEYRRTALFTLVFALAILQKETLCLYAAALFLLQTDRLSWPRNLAVLAGFVLLFAVVHGAVVIAFAGNPGAGHEYYLPDQIAYFSEKVHLPDFILMVTAIALVFYRFPFKSRMLRCASIVMLPWFCLFMVGGVQREARVMFEIFPIIVLLALDTLVRMILGEPKKTRERAEIMTV
jgi:hypothetical protein